MGQYEVGIRIDDYLYGRLLPSIRGITGAGMKVKTADIIMQIMAFYGSVRGIIDRKTREEIDEVVNELVSEDKMIGRLALILWVHKVFFPVLSDHNLIKYRLGKSVVVQK